MSRLLLLALAGAAGTLSRYGVGVMTLRLFGPGFPVGTALVNLAGCFLAGLAFAWLEGRPGVPADARQVLLIGFMGAFTTFSALMLDTAALIRDERLLHGALNLVGQSALGLTLMVAGLAAGRAI